jgi:putative PEP-CTERM system TPR-repeat lipoprotein
MVHLELLDAASAIKELEGGRRLGASPASYLIALSRAYLFANRNREIIASMPMIDTLATPREKSEFLAIVGYAHLNENEYVQAKQLFEQALEMDRNVYSLVANSRIAATESTTQEALDFLEEAREIAPENTEVLAGLASVMSRNGEWTRAIEHYSQILERLPGLVDIRVLRAEAYAQTGDFSAARADIQAVLTRDPSHVPARHLLALLDLTAKSYESAQRLAEEVLQSAPNHFKSHYVLGVAHYAQDRFEQATAHLEQYVSTQPNHAAAVRLLGAAHIRLKRFEQAIERLKDFDSRYGHRDAILLQLLGTAYLSHGEFENAIDVIQRALAISPELARSRDQLVLSLIATGRIQGAIDQIELALNLPESSARDDLLLVLAYRQKKDYTKAYSHLEKAINKHPQNNVFPYIRGVLYFEEGRLDEASVAFSRGLELDENHVPTLVRMANLESKKGNTETAREYFHKALKIQPDHLRSLMALSQLSEREGDTEALIKWLETARERNPHSSVPVKFLVSYFLREGEIEKASVEAERFYAGHATKYMAISLMARVALAKSKFDDAEAFLHRLVQLSDTDTFHRLKMVELLLRKKEYTRAIPYLEEIIAANPRHDSAYSIKARTLIHLGRLEEAEQTIGQLHRHVPDSHSIDELRGDLEFAKGREEEAFEFYRVSFSKRPTMRLTNLLTHFHARRSDLENVAVVLETYLQQAPEDIPYRIRLADTYKRLGKHTLAIGQYESIIDGGTGDHVVLNNLASLYWLENDERSLEVARKAFELAPQVPEVADTLGWIMLHRGDKESALELLEFSASKRPNNPSIRYHLTKALVLNNNHDRARTELNTVLRKFSGFSERDEAMALAAELK